MLCISVPPIYNYWDEVNECFINFEGCERVELEHSLVSVSLWEEMTHKAFIGTEKTNEDMLLYIRCMCINKDDVPDDTFYYLTEQNLERIQDYLNDDHTATTFRTGLGKQPGESRKKDIVTSEVIYYRMIENRIPIEFERWHFGRLMVLLRVFDEYHKEAEQAAKRKSGRRGKSRVTSKEQIDLARRFHEINERRKKELGTRG